MVSTIILAGGKSKRFGTDKKFYKIFGKTFLEHVYNAVKKFSSEIIISISSQKDIERVLELLPDVKIIVDEYNIRNPINGLKSCVKFCNHNIVAIAPCDTPFIVPEVYIYMMQFLGKHSAVIPKLNDRILILNAIFKKASLESGLKNLNLHNRVRDILKYINDVIFIDAERLRKYDKNLITFYNINSKEDLIKIKNYCTF